MVLQLIPSSCRHRCQSDEQGYWGAPALKAPRQASDDNVNVVRRRQSYGKILPEDLRVIGCSPSASSPSAPGLSNLPLNTQGPSNVYRAAISSDLVTSCPTKDAANAQRGGAVDPMLLLLPLRVLCPSGASACSSSTASSSVSIAVPGSGPSTTALSAPSPRGVGAAAANSSCTDSHLDACLNASAAQLSGRAAPSSRRPAAGPPVSSACPALPSVFPQQRGLTTCGSGKGRDCSVDTPMAHGSEAKEGGTADVPRLPQGCEARRASQEDGNAGGGRLGPSVRNSQANPAPQLQLQQQPPHRACGGGGAFRSVDTLPSIPGAAAADGHQGPCPPKGAAGGPHAELRPLVLSLRLPSLTSVSAAAPPQPAGRANETPAPPVCRSQAADGIVGFIYGASRSSSWVASQSQAGGDPTAALAVRGLSGAIA